eukprot:snap_masked-scaffold359_size197282-processed-gene-0.15 protein:Tk01287 transcript:snap_masked-scaffold359_size197282-processed-gene-0.15-mRNA-1 annotation:"prolyl 4-hydroxylase subunit alpha-2 isoform x2"
MDRRLINANEIDYDFNIFENFGLLKDIYKNEAHLFESLKTYRDEIALLKESLEHDYLKKSSDGPNVDTSHPVDVFYKIKLWMRLNLSFESSKRAMELRVAFNETLKAKSEGFPSFTDTTAGLRGLLYLFETYEIDPEEAARGHVKGAHLPLNSIDFKAREVLDVTDFGVLGELAFTQNRYGIGSEMFKTYANLLPHAQQSKIIPERMLDYFAKIKDNLVSLNNQNLMKRNFFVGKKHFTTRKLLNPDLTVKKKQGKMATKKFDADLKTPEGMDYLFQRNCRGQPLILPNEFQPDPPAPQHCRYLHHHDPFLRLAPFQLEIISQDPYIVIFHGILCESEMEFLIEYSKPRLSRTRELVSDENEALAYENGPKGNKIRIVAKTVQCWLDDIKYRYNPRQYPDLVDRHLTEVVDTNFDYDVVHPIMLKLSKKIESATRMNVTSKYAASKYQATNYGLGGLCEAHMDPHGYQEGKDIPYSRQDLKLTGDMLGTFMGWLNHVEVGGATAFLDPRHQVTVWPTRGSAAFWLSLAPDGRRNIQTTHAGCPILKGSKWILNKWLYSYDQFRHYPCGLTNNATHRGFTGLY